MTMPEKTKLTNSSTKNKKMIGNAVPSDFVQKLGEAWNDTDAISGYFSGNTWIPNN